MANGLKRRKPNVLWLGQLKIRVRANEKWESECLRKLKSEYGEGRTPLCRSKCQIPNGVLRRVKLDSTSRYSFFCLSWPANVAERESSTWTMPGRKQGLYLSIKWEHLNWSNEIGDHYSTMDLNFSGTRTAPHASNNFNLRVSKHALLRVHSASWFQQSFK